MITQNTAPLRMLTIKEASKVIEGLTEYRIREMCISGELPSVKAGRKYLICEQVLIDTICNSIPKNIETQNRPQIRRVAL